jgi:hypothetical protein
MAIEVASRVWLVDILRVYCQVHEEVHEQETVAVSLAQVNSRHYKPSDSDAEGLRRP